MIGTTRLADFIRNSRSRLSRPSAFSSPYTSSPAATNTSSLVKRSKTVAFITPQQKRHRLSILDTIINQIRAPGHLFCPPTRNKAHSRSEVPAHSSAWRHSRVFGAGPQVCSKRRRASADDDAGRPYIKSGRRDGAAQTLRTPELQNGPIHAAWNGHLEHLNSVRRPRRCCKSISVPYMSRGSRLRVMSEITQQVRRPSVFRRLFSAAFRRLGRLCS